MLSNSINSEESSKIITEKNQPFMLDSGNPFMFTQTATLEDNSLRIIDEKKQNKLDRDIELNKSFFDNQIQNALLSIDKFGDNPYVFNNIGLVYMNNGEYGEATKYFNKAIEIKPKFRLALFNLAKTFFMQNNFVKAIELYNRLLEYYPQDTKALQNLAHAFFNVKEIDKAEELLMKVIKMEENNASAYNNLCVIYLIKNEIDKALSFIRKALKINDRFANAYNNMGLCFERQNKYKKAINSYLAAISLNKNFKTAIKNLAYSYQEIGEYEKSFKIIDKYHSINNPDFESYDIAAFSLFKLKQYKLAITLIKKALQDSSISISKKEKAHFYNNMGAMYERLNRFQDADNCYVTSLSLDTSNLITFNNLISSYLRKHEVSKARECVEKVKKLFPDSADSLLAEAKYLYYLCEYSDACSLLNKSINLNPKLISSYVLLNHILTDIYEKYDDAIAVAKEGLKYEPDNLMLLNNLAYTLLLDNRSKEARDILDNIEDEQSVYLVATRGLLLINEGSIDEGERLYNRAIFLASSDNDLMKRVKQKKYLELARFYLNHKDYQLANKHIIKAMDIKVKLDIYKGAIKKMSELICIDK